MNIKNKNITIIGAGMSGIGAAQLAYHFGANVFLSDQKKISHEFKKNISYEEGKHSKKCYDCDFAIVSPGVPTDNPFFNQFNKQKIEVISEIEFASWYTKSPIIGVTGSNGKSTTVSILNDIFLDEYDSTYMGGNIGIPFSLNVLDENTKNKSNNIHILELSSFQLERITTFKPNVACILNLSEDHLDRYDSLIDYYNAKFNISKNLDKNDYLVYNYNDKNYYSKLYEKTNLIQFSSKGKGLNFNVENNHIIENNTKNTIIDCNQTKLKGEHNIENILAAIQIAKLFNIDNDVIKKAITNFNPLEHRMEVIKKEKNITYINDSKSTNIKSALKAIESSNQDTILILGGYSKGLVNYKDHLGVKLNNIINIICYGNEGENIYKQLKNTYKCQYIKKFNEAIVASIKLAKNNNRVLLSPACSSYDQFNNFEERGNAFKQIVNNHLQK
ncbi:MAG: UDP-N-acetylmuramoyl-L-alanine--D-glutamate ligase [Candidatus Marinimicrobia bacterium]|nr:UDP-N-acetylmuramoyl-L-alanine--D-glutamate ligase [Candidatus Neomarinimicrobiota bacterium]|tara:strand:- start:19245 stop:20579 length:1335 start_codon:yes stop_codon:yes gene_type:complete